MQIEPNSVYVLHTRPFKDSSSIVECFSRQHGIVSVVARGARRPRSRVYSLLQPFMLVQMAWIGRSDLKTLTSVEAQVNYPKLREQKILLGLYLNELLIRLLQRMDPHPLLFDQYDMTLQSLSLTSDSVQQQSLLREFELTLLAELGYGLDLTKDARTGEAIFEELLYSYDPSIGIFETSNMMHDSSQVAVSGACILALGKGSFTALGELREAKKLMRYILSFYLGNKPLQSRKLFQYQNVELSS